MPPGDSLKTPVSDELSLESMSLVSSGHWNKVHVVFKLL